MTPTQLAAFEALQKQLHNLEEAIGSLHQLTLCKPRPETWEHVHELVSCLDSIADVMRQALDSVG